MTELESLTWSKSGARVNRSATRLVCFSFTDRYRLFFTHLSMNQPLGKTQDPRYGLQSVVLTCGESTYALRSSLLRLLSSASWQVGICRRVLTTCFSERGSLVICAV